MENRFIQLDYNFYNLSDIRSIIPYKISMTENYGIEINYKDETRETISPYEMTSDLEVFNYIKSKMQELY